MRRMIFGQHRGGGRAVARCAASRAPWRRPSPLNLTQGNVSAAAAGGAHLMLLTQRGRVYACGANDFGQLGVGGYEWPPHRSSRASSRPRALRAPDRREQAERGARRRRAARAATLGVGSGSQVRESQSFSLSQMRTVVLSQCARTRSRLIQII